MITAAERQLKESLAHDLVGTAAPDELALFPLTSDAFFARGGKLSDKERDDMLGFGAEAVVTFMTPLLLTVTGAVVDYLVDEFASSAKERAVEKIQDVLARIFKRAPSGAQVLAVELTPLQVLAIRQIVTQKARELRISEGRASVLADAVVGRLASPV